MEGSLQDMHLLYTEHGNEFKNSTMEELLETFEMECSLSHIIPDSEIQPPPNFLELTKLPNVIKNIITFNYLDYGYTKRKADYCCDC